MGKNKINVAALGLTEIQAGDAQRVNGGVHMSAANYQLLQQLLAVHNAIVGVRQARAALYAFRHP